MELSRRQRRALEAICDTFVPAADGLPSATAAGVPDALLQALDRAPRDADRRALAQLLSVWDVQRFNGASQERRERILRRWADSPVPQMRAAFQALRKGATVTYYAGAPDAWAAIGYPGPLGVREDAPPRALAPVSVTTPTELSCDVVIVGSGAGGGTAAAVLADAGLDVVVLEAGEYYDDADFDGGEAQAFERMYMDGGAGVTSDGGVGLLAGACLGGGTVINYTTSFRTPDAVRAEWAGHGLPELASEAYSASLDAVCARLGVTFEYSTPGTRDEVMARGLDALGWHVDAMPRNVRGCDQGVDCGRCGFGCRLGAKQSVVKTWLADAAAAGARLLVGVRASRVLVSGGSARGVEAVSSAGHRVVVRSRAVVAAAGAIHTPALLLRSGLRNTNVGRWLRLHPVTAVFGMFEDDLRPWEGTMQARYSDEHADLDGAGYGVKYETGPMNPSQLLTFAPFRSAAQHAELVGALSRTGVVGVIVRDRDSGRVRVDRDGLPIVEYRISARDAAHARAGVVGGARVLAAAGAQRIYSAHVRLVEWRAARGDAFSSFVSAGDAAGYASGRCAYVSFHIMGSARMGGSPATSACNPDGETWEVRDLVVCDGSLFPTASGVNPMISIEALAHLNARRLAARLAG
jgi:choline dehydrogenase-like flavoprotein